jgi:predicted PurR-regulated permease PerM
MIRIVFLSSLAVFSFLVFTIGSVFTPFLVAIIMAYILQPLVIKLEHMKLPKWASSLLLFTLLVGIVITILIISIPTIYNQLYTLLMKLPFYLEELQVLVEGVIQNNPSIPEQYGDSIKKAIQSSLLEITSLLAMKTDAILQGGLSLIHFVGSILLIPILGFYFTRDWDKIVKSWTQYIPPQYKKTTFSLLLDVDYILGSFARGQSFICLCLALYYGTMLYILGLDFGALIGTLTGLAACVPYIGVIIGFTVSSIIALVQSDGWLLGPTGSSNLLLATTVIFISGQVLEGVFLTPNILGKSIRLHPLWIIFSLISFGYILGFKGVLIATPLAAILGVFVRFALNQYKSAFKENK